MATAVAVVTQVTAVVVAVALTVARRVSLMVIALRVLTVTPLHALKQLRVSRQRQALTPVVQSNPRAHPMVATTAATTMIAHRAAVATPAAEATPVTVVATAATAATLVAVKIVVLRSLIAVGRIHASVLRALIRRHVHTKAVRSVVHWAVIARMRVLLLDMLATVTAMIAQHAPSVTAIRVRLLIVLRVPILIVRTAVIVSSVRLAHLRGEANTPLVLVPSARSHSSAPSVRNIRRVRCVRSSMKLARHVTRSALTARQAPPRPLQPTVAIAPHGVLLSRLSTRPR